VVEQEVTQKAFAEPNGMPVTKVQAAFRLVRDELVVGG
jgi:hypothetical protein